MDDDFDEKFLLEAANQADQYLDATKPKLKHTICLQTKFGHNEFRPRQWDIIRSIIEDKRDNCVIMPTGYGKSLLFQYPAVFTNGITLVVSPLISLMQDQVRSLSVANISACFLGSAQTQRDMDARVLAGEFRLVYASPEYLINATNWLKLLESQLTLIAIDEAHCVSQWGHDFRADYRRLDIIRRTIPSVPILSVTATATDHVQDDIIRSLQLRSPQVVNMGFDRPNIHFTFKPKFNDIWEDLKPHTTLLKGSTIIYVLKKATSEEIAKILRNHGVACEIYHAGLPLAKRKSVLNDFTKDILNVIVATVAFGMGIDKPDVRTIVHYGASKNIETYYQEVGRAGRDGGRSHAITYFSRDDFNLHDWFLNENVEHKSEAVIQHLRDIGQKMREFCYTAECRRKCLLNYFGSNITIQSRRNCCDNCDRGSSSIRLSDQYENIDDNGNYNFTQNAYIYMRALEITGKSAVAISVLRGSSEKNAVEFKNRQEVYGTGKKWSKEYWMILIQQLKCYDYVTTKPLPAPYRPITVLSLKGSTWLNTEAKQPLVLKAIPEMYRFFVKKRHSTKAADNNFTPQNETPVDLILVPVDAVKKEVIEENFDDLLCNQMGDTHLEEILLTVRKALARQNDCMPFSVASNTAIMQMVTKKPVSITEFKSHLIEGFSLAKIDKFATPFINAIIKFMTKDFCMNNLLSTHPLKKYPSHLLAQDRLQLLKRIDSLQSLKDIQQEFDLPHSVLIEETANFMRLGFSVSKLHLFHLVQVNDEMLAFIRDKTTNDDLDKLNNIKEIRGKYCDHSKITDQMLQLTLHYLKIRQFLNLIKIPYFDVDSNQFNNVENFISETTIVNVQSSPKLMGTIDRLAMIPTASTVIQISRNKIVKPLESPSVTSYNSCKKEEKSSIIRNESEQQRKNAPSLSSLYPGRNLPSSTKNITVKSTGWIQTKPSKRLIVKSSSKTKYLSDSDDEVDKIDAKRKNVQPEGSQRTMSQWISTKTTRK